MDQILMGNRPVLRTALVVIGRRDDDDESGLLLKLCCNSLEAVMIEEGRATFPSRKA